MAKIHVSVSAEPIFNLGNFEVTNSMLASLGVSLLLVGLAYWLSKNLEKTKRPKGIQNAVEMVIEALYNLTLSIAGERKTREFFPVIATLFIYILFANWLELLPGLGTIGLMSTHQGKEIFSPFIRPPSADINATLGLALFSVVGSQVVGYKYLKLEYFKRFFNFRHPGRFILGLLELVSELSRIISFSFRLFGNIFAGEVLLTVSLALLPFLAPLPFLGLEIFIGLIQAFVFAILTLVFWNMATVTHNQEH